MLQKTSIMGSYNTKIKEKFGNLKFSSYILCRKRLTTLKIKSKIN